MRSRPTLAGGPLTMPESEEMGNMTGAAGVPGNDPGATARARVLVVDDEPTMLRALRVNLRARGYDVTLATDGEGATAEAARRPPDAILLDLGLPDIDGVEVIRRLRGWTRAPVIVLSGRRSLNDTVAALDAGADDYVSKPFSMEELLARLRAVLRREEGGAPGSHVVIGRLQVDMAAHSVLDGDGRTVHLTPTEWRLLETLLRHPGQLVPGDRLLAQVWGHGYEGNAHYLRFHMARLRRKLEADPSRPRHLLTEPGLGYRYQP